MRVDMRAELIDVMGDDLRVVNSARVSFNKESAWEYDWDNEDYVEGPHLSVQDEKLIKYLATHGHWTPFSHVMITMRETVPIFVARQRFKHMVGFTYNEVSRRYVDDTPEFYVPDAWRKRADNKKQGSSEETINLLHWDLDYHEPPVPKHISVYKESWEAKFPNEPWGEITETYEIDGSIDDGIRELYDIVLRVYNNLIAVGVAPEQARMVLPQSMYTSYYVTGSLAAWARAYKQRIDGHAQKEIQDLAKQWDEIISYIPALEHSWRALAHATKEGTV